MMDELLQIAQAQDCSFPPDFKQKTMEEMVRSAESNSIMYQDFMAKRPMEVETYLGSPIKLAQSVGRKVPRIETLYALLHHINILNQQRPREAPVAPAVNGNAPYPARLSSTSQSRPPMNGMNGMNGGANGMMNGMGRGRGGRTSSMGGPPPGPMPGMRRGGPMNGGPNGYGRPMPNGYGPPGGRPMQSRRGSIDNDLAEDFSHVVLYDDIPERGSPLPDELNIRERELMIRQREAALREQELRMRSRPGPRRGPPTPSVRNGGFDDDDDDDEYFDPTSRPAPQLIDPDNFDMMSVTSRRTRKAPSASQIRNNPEADSRSNRGGYGRPPMFNRNRSSARLISTLPGTHDSIMDDPLMGYSSNRYGAVDRQSLHHDSRAASLTNARLDEMHFAGSQNGPYPRRTSQSPGNPYSPQMGRGNGRPSPPNGYGGYPNGGRPSPPGGMRQPIPQYPPGQGNTVAPQQVEQHAGVSALNPPKGPMMNNGSLTGSASASARSGDSANLDSENSAHSSQSSLGPRLPVGVR